FLLLFSCSRPPRHLHSFPTRRSSDLVSIPATQPSLYLDTLKLDAPKKGVAVLRQRVGTAKLAIEAAGGHLAQNSYAFFRRVELRSEEHTSELQSQSNLVCRLLLEKKK